MNESSEMFKVCTEILLSLLHQVIATINMQIIVYQKVFINNTCKKYVHNIISCVIKNILHRVFRINLKRNQQYAE